MIRFEQYFDHIGLFNKHFKAGTSLQLLKLFNYTIIFLITVLEN